MKFHERKCQAERRVLKRPIDPRRFEIGPLTLAEGAGLAKPDDGGASEDDATKHMVQVVPQEIYVKDQDLSPSDMENCAAPMTKEVDMRLKTNLLSGIILFRRRDIAIRKGRLILQMQ